jgi:hypothetical protein
MPELIYLGNGYPASLTNIEDKKRIRFNKPIRETIIISGASKGKECPVTP